MKVTFAKIFKAATFSFEDGFEVFHASFFKVFVYFVLLNIMMLLPISLQVVQMKDFNYERYGMTFATTDIPEWLPNDIPRSCIIENNYLDCGMDQILEYELVNNDKTYTVYFNVPSDVVYDEDNIIIFYHHGINLHLNGSVLRLTYIGLEGIDFATFEDMDQAVAAGIIFEGLFQSVKPILVLPFIIFGVGALFLANLFLVVFVSALSMLFKFNQSDYPSYPNMLKLFMIGSTIPAILNVILGFLGLSAFTSLTYNFITPVMVLLIYRASRRKISQNI